MFLGFFYSFISTNSILQLTTLGTLWRHLGFYYFISLETKKNTSSPIATSTSRLISAIAIIIEIETIAVVKEVSIISLVIVIKVRSYFPTFTNQLCPTSPAIMRTHILFHSFTICKTGRSSLYNTNEYL